MTTLPEEAVKAADVIQVITDLRLAILQDDDEGLAEHAEPMIKAKELVAKLSALPFLPVQGAVKVKPLEWIEVPACNGLNTARTKFGTYTIGSSLVVRYGLKSISKPLPTLEAAKAAAQADYEARILSALEPSAARELALEEAARNLIAVRYDTYTARNGKLCSIEGDDGEKAWIVPFDAMADLENALSSPDHADAGKVEGDGWMPIESAPKDGECVLVWKPDEPRVGEYICVAYWDDAIIKRTPQWVDVAGRALGFLSKVDGKPQGYPTHWRPLPSAPASEGGE